MKSIKISIISIIIFLLFILTIESRSRNANQVKQRYLEYRARFGKTSEPRQMQTARLTNE